jgi:hypothetical protein
VKRRELIAPPPMSENQAHLVFQMCKENNFPHGFLMAHDFHDGPWELFALSEKLSNTLTTRKKRKRAVMI